jgi:hypothetical protein
MVVSRLSEAEWRHRLDAKPQRRPIFPSVTMCGELKTKSRQGLGIRGNVMTRWLLPLAPLFLCPLAAQAGNINDQ